MAYCKSCGAYIPDGQTACLACGYNDSEKKRHPAHLPALRQLRPKRPRKPHPEPRAMRNINRSTAIF